jgi:hypothetical protein
MPKFDTTLQDWNELAGESWSGLLIGNGASIAVWPGFQYRSLFERAVEAGVLDNEDGTLFDRLDTRNFEEVLSQLATARRVEEALGESSDHASERYDHIRDALISAVQAVHIRYGAVPESTLVHVKDYLKSYAHVYSTNYDLLLYWSMMREQDAFDDYFRKRDGALRFVPPASTSSCKPTHVVYLHGAIHLYRIETGETLKDFYSGGEDLLTRFETARDWRTTTPLFVSEGDAPDKLRSIRRSDYLSFGLHQFAEHSGQLVVFSSAIMEGDQHLVNLMRG